MKVKDLRGSSKPWISSLFVIHTLQEMIFFINYSKILLITSRHNPQTSIILTMHTNTLRDQDPTQKPLLGINTTSNSNSKEEYIKDLEDDIKDSEEEFTWQNAMQSMIVNLIVALVKNSAKIMFGHVQGGQVSDVKE